MSDTEDRIKGWPVKQAAKLAEEWWDRAGRHIINRKFNESYGPAKVRAPGLNAPGILIRPSAQTVIPSGILMGEQWSVLTKEERWRVVETWAEFHAVDDSKPDAALVHRLSLDS